MAIYRTGSTMTHLQSYLNAHTADYQNSMEQLSSGNKYTSINDNPVEVSKSIKLASEIATNKRASTNVDLGKDMLTMTEEAQNNLVSNIQRLNDLSVEVANGTYTASDKDAIIEEIRSRLAYIDKSADNTNFNGFNILQAPTGTVSLQTGTSSNTRMDITNAFIDTHTAALGIDLPATVNGSNWTNAQVGAYMNKLNAATATIITAQTQVGGYLNRLDSISDTITNTNNNLTQKRSVIADADVAEASADLVKYQIAQEASVSIFTQTNKISALALGLLNQ